jgi:tetratricopeptide (TPR) repeat protein
LLETGKKKLEVVGKGILAYFADTRVEIQGHTDASPCRIGPHCKFKDNQSLSEARAQTVRDLFVRIGVKPENITVNGFAERVPIATNDTPEGRSLNRRIEISLKSDKLETPETVLNAAFFLMNIGQMDQALKLFRTLENYQPEKAQNHKLVADCLFKMGQTEEAQKENEQAMALEKSEVPAK